MNSFEEDIAPASPVSFVIRSPSATHVTSSPSSLSSSAQPNVPLPQISVTVLGGADVGKSSVMGGLGIDTRRRYFDELRLRDQRLLMLKSKRGGSSSEGLVLYDFALLVVSAKHGEFELGEGTKASILRARTLGVRKMVVAVTKMDTVQWDYLHYLHIVTEVSSFLENCGYSHVDSSSLMNEGELDVFKDHVNSCLIERGLIVALCGVVLDYIGVGSMPDGAVFCPTSCGAWAKHLDRRDYIDEDTRRSFVPAKELCADICDWYEGRGLRDLLECCGSTVVKEHMNARRLPLRLCVLGTVHSSQMRYDFLPEGWSPIEEDGFVVFARVVYGELRMGDELVSQSGIRGLCGTILSCPRFDEVKVANAGDLVVVVLMPLAEPVFCEVGSIFSHPSTPLSMANELVVQVQIASRLLHYKPLFTAGYTCMLLVHASTVECEVSALLARFERDPTTRRLVKQKKKPVYFRGGEYGIVKLRLTYPVVSDSHSEFPRLGFVVLLDRDQIIATGKIRSGMLVKDQ